MWFTSPLLAYGLTRSAGTRKPYPRLSTLGGGTWSYQPPHPSYVHINADVDQAELFINSVVTLRKVREPALGPAGGFSLELVVTM